MILHLIIKIINKLNISLNFWEITYLGYTIFIALIMKSYIIMAYSEQIGCYFYCKGKGLI